MAQPVFAEDRIDPVDLTRPGTRVPVDASAGRVVHLASRPRRVAPLPEGDPAALLSLVDGMVSRIGRDLTEAQGARLIADEVFRSLEPGGTWIWDQGVGYALSREAGGAVPLTTRSPALEEFLLDQTGLLPERPLFDAVRVHLCRLVRARGRSLRVRRIAWSPSGRREAFVHSLGWTIYRITPDGIEAIEPGVSGVVFAAIPGTRPFTFDPAWSRTPAPSLMRLIIQAFPVADGPLSPLDQQSMLRLWLYAFMLLEDRRDIPDLLLVSPPGSDPQAPARRLITFLTGCVPDGPIGSSPYPLSFVDWGTPEANRENPVARARVIFDSTSRSLGTSLASTGLPVWLTSRPFVIEPEGPFLAHRNRLMSELLTHLQVVLRAQEKEPLSWIPPHPALHAFSDLCRRVAASTGRSLRIHRALSYLGQDWWARQVDASDLCRALRRSGLGQPSVRLGTADLRGQLAEDLEGAYGAQPDWLQSDESLDRTLREESWRLRRHLRIEFEECPDGTSRWHLAPAGTDRFTG